MHEVKNETKRAQKSKYMGWRLGKVGTEFGLLGVALVTFLYQTTLSEIAVPRIPATYLSASTPIKVKEFPQDLMRNSSFLFWLSR